MALVLLNGRMRQGPHGVRVAMMSSEGDHSSVDYLERQYNNRLSISDAADYNARAIRESECARRELRCVLDLPYGTSPRERIDVFLGEGAAPRPLLVFIHGGYWRSRDKSEFSFVARPFVSAGVTVALPSYDLAPMVTVGKIVDQVRAAVARLYGMAGDLGIDASRVYLTGHSAGAHLAAMALVPPPGAIEHAMMQPAIRGVYCVSGIYDLAPLLHTSFNRDVRLDDASARAFSPVNCRPYGAVPLYTARGALESAEFRRQVEVMRSAWPQCHAGHLEVPGCHHLSVLDALVDPRSSLFRGVFDMVGS